MADPKSQPHNVPGNDSQHSIFFFLDILLLELLLTRNSVLKGVLEILCLILSLVQKLNNVSKFEVVKARNLTYTEHI